MMHRNLDLFFTFLKIGSFTFGGGYAMIPLIQGEMVEKKKWITEEEMVDMIAIAESTPGVIAVNSATFVGYKIGKFWGSLLATIGVVLPSLIVIILVSLFFENFLEIKMVDYAFRGIRAGVSVLIFNAAIKFLKVAPKSALGLFLIALSFFTSLFISGFRYLSVSLIAFGAVIGLLTQMEIRKKLPSEGKKPQ
jgi:chromate transporter